MPASRVSSLSPEAQRARLGRVLEAHADEVGGMVAERVHPGIAGGPSGFDPILDSAILATRLTARWLIRGEGATGSELESFSRNGESPLAGGGTLVDLAKSYLAWRDVTLALMASQAERLEVSAEVLRSAEVGVRRSCDAGLVRMCRTFDATRSYLEDLIQDEQARLTHVSLHDQLTDLANRAQLLACLEAQPTPGQGSSAVLFVDLDRFKAVNDRLGHAGGDELLVAVARRMIQLVRHPDVVARLGGDEFVILALGLADPAADATRLAERLRASLSEPFAIRGEQISVSASIGIALREVGEDPENVIDRADRAMYKAKDSGRDRFECYSPNWVPMEDEAR